MLAITEDPNFDIDNVADLETNKQTFIITDVLKNVRNCQKFYINIYYFCSSSFKKLVLSSPPYIIIVREMQLDWKGQENLELLTPRKLLKYSHPYNF